MYKSEEKKLHSGARFWGHFLSFKHGGHGSTHGGREQLILLIGPPLEFGAIAHCAGKRAIGTTPSPICSLIAKWGIATMA